MLPVLLILNKRVALFLFPAIPIAFSQPCQLDMSMLVTYGSGGGGGVGS